MNARSSRYPSAVIALHWLTLALLVAVYCLIEFRGIFPKDSVGRDAMKHWHFMLGLTVFCVVWLRLALRATFHAPAITPPPPAWQMLAARAMHVALYVFLIVMPVLGWSTLSAKGGKIPFFGLELPPLLAADKALGKRLEGIHETVGIIGLALIGLHAAAALFHHYLMRDDTLRRMGLRKPRRD
ncbi:MAG: cytochrome b [Nevskiaceae bacterium]|nr:MAG: cytochrome b [Nevskiaceae bacterium]TBR73256.1 MAG: cytochrome b [Nevskiaceae bacterium]